MCWNRYKGYRICGHRDPEATPLAVERCGEPDRHPWEPECAEKEWKLLHDGSKTACPECCAKEPSVPKMVAAYTSIPRQLMELGLNLAKIEGLQAFGKAGRLEAERERKKGPDNGFYEAFLPAYEAFEVESRRVMYEMIDEEETEREEREEREEKEREEKEREEKEKKQREKEAEN